MFYANAPPWSFLIKQCNYNNIYAKWKNTWCRTIKKGLQSMFPKETIKKR